MRYDSPMKVIGALEVIKLDEYSLSSTTSIAPIKCYNSFEECVEEVCIAESDKTAFLGFLKEEVRPMTSQTFFVGCDDYTSYTFHFMIVE